jgi:methionyl-tRNA formyltransferase
MRAVVFAYSNVGDRCLRVLRAQGVDVPLVVTHRDRPGEMIWFDRVADTAAELGLATEFADDGTELALVDAVVQARPDVIFSFYFRALLPDAILRAATRGAYNMHGSLLPRYRGRAPTNWAVLHGESETGATLHAMVAKADAGEIVDQQTVPILPDDTALQVFAKVTVAAEQVLWRSLPSIVDGTVTLRPNDIERGSYFGSRRPEDGRIEWAQPVARVYNLIRAVAPPYPGAFTELFGIPLVVAKARRAPFAAGEAARVPPGLHVFGDDIVGICGDGGRIAIHELRAGGERVSPATLRALLARAGPSSP